MKLKRRDDVTDAQPNEEKKVPDRASSKKRELSVIIYTTVLFVFALGLILLSYFIEQRTNNKLTDMSNQHSEFSVQALQNIEALQQRNQELEQQLADAQKELDELTQKYNDLSVEADTTEGQRAELEVRLQETKDELASQRSRTEAVGMLAALLAAKTDEERASIKTAMDPLVQYLDGAYLQIYNNYISAMNGEGQ